MTTVFSCHGFNVFDGGRGSTDKLRPYFERAGFEFAEKDYGWRGLLGVRFLNKKTATELMRLVKPGDIGVGHSNGCDILLRAARQGAPFSQLVLINPALDRATLFPAHIKRIHVWHSPSDKAVRFARFLPWHHWGAMGAYGYTGHDDRVVNYNKQNDFRVSSRSHSDVFEADKLRFFAPIIVDCVTAAGIDQE